MVTAAVLTATALGGERMNLAGKWAFQLDPQDQGVAESWANKALPDKIKLPGTTDLAGYGQPEADPNPGFLSREHKYIGAAWYQRTIEIPVAWQGEEVELFLERVLWQSRVWIDGRDCDPQDSLGTPHIHRLGRLAPGRHRLTIRIDNRMIHPIGDRGHCYTEFTQTIWNGVVGRIELRALSSAHLGLVRVFPDAAARKVVVEAEIIGQPAGSLALTLREAGSGKIVARGDGTSLSLPVEPNLWDEFAPNLYQLDVALGEDRREITFGFRTITRAGHRLLINGRPAFLRGNMDCAQYPETGHPPMDVESWKRMYRTCRQYGLNQVRFHSWCPPEAAFQAADEMGFYVQPEVLWIDGWMSSPNSRKDMDTPGYPKGVGRGDRTIDPYVRPEMRRMLDTYGNHPSFCFFSIGNEMGSSDFKVMGDWIKEEKERDPRRFYAASAARTITPFDDFSDTHDIPGVGGVVNNLGVPHTDWDYQKSYSRAPVPIFAHEMGQMPVYPDWREIAKYTGPLRARSFELFRQQARTNGIEAQSADFQQASGAMNRIIYKNEMEAQLRSAGCSGVSWLSLQDFPGQGEALVGWLDTLYESKGIVTPEQFRRYSAPTVPLARFKKFVWTTNDTFRATLQVSHYGPQPLEHARPVWRLGTAHGTLPETTLPVGSLTTLGEIEVALDRQQAPAQLTLELRLDGTPFANDWDLWVFPSESPAPAPANVLVTEQPTEAWDALARGGRVLLLAHKLGSPKYAAWMPLFWSARFFPGQDRDTLGAFVQSRHPALAGFPTANHLDWQWWELCQGARGFVLDDQPAGYRPIVQPVSDYHFNHKLGSLFELATAEGGRLLVSGYNLDHGPAARQLRHSLLAYAGSDAFRPQTPLTRAAFGKLLGIVAEAPIVLAPPGFEKAVLYVKAGAHHPSAGDVPWKTAWDEVRAAPGFTYKVQCNAVWKDDTAAAWWGSPVLRVELEVDKPELYDLYVHFHDWNDNGRRGKLHFEGRECELGPHNGPGKWVKLAVMREDCLDGKLVLAAEPTTGPNLMITDVVLLPRKP